MKTNKCPHCGVEQEYDKQDGSRLKTNRSCRVCFLKHLWGEERYKEKI